MTQENKKILADVSGSKGVELPQRPATSNLRMLNEDQKSRYILRHRLKARKLARSILRKWNSRLDIEEVDSYVDLSLCEAANRFSPDMGASFMTFLYYHLRGNLIRAISSAANANTVPFFDNESVVSDDDGDRVSSQMSTTASEIADALIGSESSRPDEILMKKEMLALTQEAKGKLDGLAKEVLNRMYVDEEQLIDIATSLGYSRCHISRVKKRALETIYDDMKNPLDLSGEHRPEEEELEEVSPRLKKRREIHRRNPRSQVAMKAKLKAVAG